MYHQSFLRCIHVFYCILWLCSSCCNAVLYIVLWRYKLHCYIVEPFLLRLLNIVLWRCTLHFYIATLSNPFVSADCMSGVLKIVSVLSSHGFVSSFGFYLSWMSHCPRYTFRRGSSRHMALAHHLFFSLSLGCPIPGIHLEGVIGNWGIVWSERSQGFPGLKHLSLMGPKISWCKWVSLGI